VTSTLTIAGSRAFNAWLDGALRDLAAELMGVLGDNGVAVVLGGGYGRGDGSVVQHDGREYPYNDIDLVLVVRHPRSVRHAPLLEVCARHEALLRAHVEFGRPVTTRNIRRWSHRLLWHDIVHGHRVLCGDPGVIARNAPAFMAAPPPAVEGSRLLLNRGAGLLRALRIAEGVEASPDGDFVVRNAYKTAQALGDALLIAARRYTPAMHARLARLDALTLDAAGLVPPDVREWYRRALEFRLAPDRASREIGEPASLRRLAAAWQQVFLQVERVRLDGDWRSADAYARWHGLREPEEHRLRKLPRNIARSLALGRVSLQYPREIVYTAMPRLLTPDASGPRWAGDSARLLALWQHVN